MVPRNSINTSAAGGNALFCCSTGIDRFGVRKSDRTDFLMFLFLSNLYIHINGQCWCCTYVMHGTRTWKVVGVDFVILRKHALIGASADQEQRHNSNNGSSRLSGVPLIAFIFVLLS